ncbi:MAG: type II CAAX endopeptidase family protein [Microlunatus sp.]
MHDPDTTRSPTEGGWSGSGDDAPPSTWQPIPSFEPTGFGPPPELQVPPQPWRAPVRRLPEVPVSYAQLLRGPTRTWWRPILAFLLLLAMFGFFTLLPLPIAMAYGLLSGETTLDGIDLWLDEISSIEGSLGPGGYLYTLLVVTVLIPAAMLSTWAVHRVRPGFLSSVAGRIRWRWVLRCLVVLAPLWVLYLGISALIEPPQSSRPEQWPILLVMAVLLTPGQAAAEEYAFRGWVLQNIGSCFRRPVLSWVIPGIVAAAAFAVAHGSLDPWILADLAAFSVAATVMTWRTGGLEAAIVLHTVNNIGVTVITTLIGGWDEVFVGEDTRGTPLTFAVSLVMNAITVALVWWQARRTGIDRFYRPVPPVV